MGNVFHGFGQQYDRFAFAHSRDGCHMAVVPLRSSGGVFVVVDGQEGPQYDSFGEGTLAFSPDSKRLAYAAGKGKRCFVVVDRQEGRTYDNIGTGSPVFSPDGKHVAYGAKKGQKWFVVVDGKEGPQYDGIGVGSPVFNPDGKRLGVYELENDEDGKPKTSSIASQCRQMTFSQAFALINH